MAYGRSAVLRSSVIVAAVAAAMCAVIVGCQLIAGIHDIELAGPDAPVTPVDSGQPNPCDAGLAFCGDACINVAADPNNCGVCGRDCQGSACNVGECQPTVVAHSTSGLISDIAVDTNDVYWIEWSWGPDGGTGKGGVYECSKVGCTQPTILATKQDDADHVAVDSTNVYWTMSLTGFVKSCAIGGCGGTPKVLASGLGHPTDIASDGVNVFWANSFDGTIVSCPVGGCGGAPTVIASNQWPWYIALDATSVYWTTGDGSVRKCGKTATCGFQPVVIASNLVNVTGIAADTKNVYWTADLGDGGANGSLGACAVGGCSVPTVLASGLPPAWDVIADGQNAYWTNPYWSVWGAALWKCSVGGCGSVPTRLVNAGGIAIAVDDMAVYWTDDFQIYRVAK